MILSPHGVALIKGFEGLSLKAYPDAAGYSIGYGHYGASPGQVITLAEADRLFLGDVARFEARVNATTPMASQHQFDAMVSLAYNIGEAAFDTSTLKAKHNAGDYDGASNEFTRWNKSGGEVHPGLVARRAKEREIYRGDNWGPPEAPAPVPNVPGPHPETRGTTLEPVATTKSLGMLEYAAIGAAVWALYQLLRKHG